MKDYVEVKLEIPKETAARVNALAELADVHTETVARVLLALHVQDSEVRQKVKEQQAQIVADSDEILRLRSKVRQFEEMFAKLKETLG